MNDFYDDARKPDNNSLSKAEKYAQPEIMSKDEMVRAVVLGGRNVPEDQLTDKEKHDIKYLGMLDKDDVLKAFNHKVGKLLGPALYGLKMQEIKSPVKDEEPVERRIADNEMYIDLLEVIANEVFENSPIKDYFNNDKAEKVKKEAKDSCMKELEDFDEGLYEDYDDLDCEDDVEYREYMDDYQSEIDFDENESATGVKYAFNEASDEENIIGYFMEGVGFDYGRARVFAKKTLENIDVEYEKLEIMKENLENAIKDEMKKTFKSQAKQMFRQHFGKKNPLQFSPINRVNNFMISIKQLQFLIDNYEALGCEGLFRMFNQPTEKRIEEDIAIMNSCKGKEIDEIKEDKNSRTDETYYKIDYLCYKYIMTPEEQLKIKNSWAKMGQYEKVVPEAYEDEDRLQGFLDKLK